MYWLIEDLEQLKVFYNSGFKKAFIEVIPFNNNIHPHENHVSLVYLRPIEARKGFMLCINHSEAFHLSKTHIDQVIQKFEVLYCRDKKEILHYFPLKSLYDITPPPNTYIQPLTQTHKIFYSQHKDNPDINLFIPIVKHYEMCERIFLDLKNHIPLSQTKYNEFFNKKVTSIFNYIETSGIQIDPKIFSEYFYPTNTNKVYTQFNLKTTTTRPSSNFKNVNYAALNKENGSRKSFIPSNDKFVEIDISAFHPNLAAHLIGYTFPTSDIHSHFATLYKTDYKKAKELTFKQLYGGVFREYRDLEFFRKIEKYKEEIWDKFINEGEVKVPISGFVYKKEELGEMNPSKLFNYVLQCLETSYHVIILWDVIKDVMLGKNSKIVLYTYDSILIDFDGDGDVDLIEEVIEIYKNYKCDVKVKEGVNYHEMEDVIPNIKNVNL